jgi:hypothetical protein
VEEMNRYLVNTPARYGNGEIFESRLQMHDLFMPPIHRNEDCCFPHSRGEFLFPFVDSREEDMDHPSMKDGGDFLKLLSGVKDTVAACFRPAGGSLIYRHRSLRRSMIDSSWTIQVLDQKHCPGDTLRFKLFPNGSHQACMVLQGAEIMDSVEVLAAGDDTQKGISFDVHMMHDDHVETMNGDEVLEFLLRVLQCMDGGEVGKKGVPTKDCHLNRKRKQACNSFPDESNGAVSIAAYHRRNRIRFPRFRRIFRKEKLV